MQGKPAGRRLKHSASLPLVSAQVISVKDYDLYCHYVAGLVGVGLSHLFASSGVRL